jgi:antitoxin (DNA-binding transcriptional repressor) of toxin-antitoxin stability system
MTLTVSISEFRNNLSQYLEKVADGTNLLVRDEKKNKLVAQISAKKEFDPVSFERTLRGVGEVFTGENHPEWRTKKDVINWLRKSRLASDRHFDNVPNRH